MAAGSTKWRTQCRGAVLFAILLQVVNGYEEIYTISQLSPKSADIELPEDTVLHTTHSDNLGFRIEPSLARYDDLDDLAPEDIVTDEETEKHIIVARSADPNDRESRSINFDEIPSSNNEIDNELELHNKRKYYDIHPTKTTGFSHENEVLMSSELGDKFEFNFPGEARRAPKARALPPLGPRIRPTAVQPMYATLNPNEGRQNTEIQNIITGIVKLLNGNVNVQANTQLLRPGRPMNSRINNRGPPRISDVPPLPDFDKPITPPTHTFHPTKTPPPYPFDRPHHGVNLPEQIVPPLNPHRPGFHRPNIPPWQRPRPRPPNMPGRRPNPGLPMYKPIPPPMPVDIPNLDEEEEADNETNHDNHLVPDDKETIPLVNLPVSNTTEENEKEENKLTTAPETTSSTTTTTSTTTEQTTTSTTEPPKTTTEKPKTTTEKPKTTTEKAKTTTETKTTTEKPKTTTERKPTTEKAKTTTETKTTTEKAKIEKKPEKKKEPFNADKKDKYKIDEKPGNKTKIETIIDIIESSIEEYKASEAASATPTKGLMSHAPTVSIPESPHSVVKTSSINAQPLPSSPPYPPYRRPGIVLDDPDFKPAGSRRDAAVLTAPAQGYGEIFDVTVSAIQGEKGASVHIENVNLLSGHGEDDIIVSPSGEQGFVSIDGKRTYLNLFDTSSPHGDVQPTRVQNIHHSAPPPSVNHPSHPSSHPHPAVGTGIAVPADPEPVPPRRPAYRPRPRPQPPVRIDTCIVGDDSTCDQAQNEKCRTEAGISSCQCRPGYARRTSRDPCRRVVSLVLNLRVDRLYDKPITWDNKLADKDSEPYQQLSYEALRAIDSAFSMTPFSDEFVGGAVTAVHRDLGPGVYVNYTILMAESGEMLRPAVGTEIHKQVLGVLRRRSNNVGASALWVDGLAGAVAPLKDLDECASPEYNDCHKLAQCINTWGGFRCSCPDTTLDAQESGPLSGRDCRACASSHCNERGTCHYTNRRPACSCSSGYYGSTCEVDGEVVGVAVGASLAAALVIAATLAALLSWSRKWSREQKAAGMGSPVFSYMQGVNTIKAPPVGGPPYQVTLEERMRWAQIAEAMAQSNHYASEANQTMATRPSSAMFGGYPTLPPVPMPRLGLHHSGTLNTVASRVNTGSHHNLYGYTNHMATESTSSEASSHAAERADLLHVPRPKSRARSLHNQTGIYYDVEYENAEPIYGAKGIPLSTYTVSRGPPFYRA